MAESREQRAESREQRAESREQRAESREQIIATVQYNVKYCVVMETIKGFSK